MDLGKVDSDRPAVGDYIDCMRTDNHPGRTLATNGGDGNSVK